MCFLFCFVHTVNIFIISVCKRLYSNLVIFLPLLRTVKPHIDRTNLENITVRAGQMIKFDAKVTGEPVPKKTWFINKARQEKDAEDVKVDEEDHRTKIVIHSCTRAHNGTFVIKAENSAGKDEVAIEVTVLGKSYF